MPNISPIKVKITWESSQSTTFCQENYDRSKILKSRTLD